MQDLTQSHPWLHEQFVRFGYHTVRRSDQVFFSFLFMHFCPGTMTTHADSINSDLHRGLHRRLRHIEH